MSGRGPSRQALNVARAAAMVLAASAIGCGERLDPTPTAEQNCQSVEGARAKYAPDGGYVDCCFGAPDSGSSNCCGESGGTFHYAGDGLGGCSIPGPFVPPEMA